MTNSKATVAKEDSRYNPYGMRCSIHLDSASRKSLTEILIIRIPLIRTRAKTEANTHFTGLHHSVSGRVSEKVLYANVTDRNANDIPNRYHVGIALAVLPYI